jgi:hypothetical protein
MFHLRMNVSTAAPATSERKRETMLEQISSGARDQSVLHQPPPRRPTAPRWRSLAVLHAGLMEEWHPLRNAGIDPYELGQYSRRKVWWRCRHCGHEWQTTPHERTFRGSGCPACWRRDLVPRLSNGTADIACRSNGRSRRFGPTWCWSGTPRETATSSRYWQSFRTELSAATQRHPAMSPVSGRRAPRTTTGLLLAHFGGSESCCCFGDRAITRPPAAGLLECHVSDDTDEVDGGIAFASMASTPGPSLGRGGRR